MLEVKNLVGRKFGLLTVKSIDHIFQRFNKKGQKDGVRYY